MNKLLFFILPLILYAGCSKDKKSDKAAEKMQEFVIHISNYAKDFNPDFIIIPQNGIEIAFNHTEPDDGLNFIYLTAINGFGIEELFYNGDYSVDQERLSMLRQLKGHCEKILVSEYITHDNQVPDAIQKNANEGFLCFPRTKKNYDYSFIPAGITNPNPDNITNLSMASNYLYLISTDNYASKQEMINAISATNYDIVLIDLFFNGIELTTAEVDQLKIKANGGQRLVISYISIGSAENFRYYWKSAWKLHNPDWIKKKYEGYDDEYWVEFWNKEWQDIIYGNNNSYMSKIISAGFDGAYLDNIEAYYSLYYND